MGPFCPGLTAPSSLAVAARQPSATFPGHPPGSFLLPATCLEWEPLQNLPAPALLSKEPNQGKPVRIGPQFQIRFTNLISYSLI